MVDVQNYSVASRMDKNSNSQCLGIWEVSNNQRSLCKRSHKQDSRILGSSWGAPLHGETKP